MNKNTFIHPTAVIEPGAQIGAGVHIGPYCIVGPHVTLHDNVTLKSHVVVDGHTTIGAGTIIYPFASLGGEPQDLKFGGEETALVIGENNKIREYVTMNTGTAGGGGVTRVGSNGLFMMGAHVAHDCIIGDHVIMANLATLAGHVVVGDHVVIGGLAAVHQFVRVGEGAVIGGVSRVVTDIIPYGRAKCDDAILEGLNIVGLQRLGLTKEQIRTLQRAFNELFGAEGTFDQRVEMVARDFKDDTLVQQIVEFIKGKTRFPICQPMKKAA
jgi:UDP-N-acetylglucosamine acyltransferase